MNSAAFLLAINFSIGISFGAAFLAISWKSGFAIGLWCALGFFSASLTTLIESLAQTIPSPHLTSTLSFSSLLLALTLISVGLSQHFGVKRLISALVLWWAVCSIYNAEVTFYLKRGTWAQGIGYQLPFAATLVAGCFIVLCKARRRTAALTLAAVLGLSAVQFLSKGILSALAGQDVGIKTYLLSEYAFYSQTAGGILSIFLGLSLVGLIVGEVMERTRNQFELDHLSGMLTRGAFMARAQKALTRAQTPIVVLCDLDHFKSINDRFGHAAGDEVIQKFGKIVMHHLNSRCCGRVGGEEFCVLFTDVPLETAITRIASLRNHLREARYDLVSADRIITASFGIAVGEPRESLAEMLRRADIALYAAKRKGRDCFQIASILANGAELDPAAISGIPES